MVRFHAALFPQKTIAGNTAKERSGQPVLFEAGTDANGRSLAKNISPADPNAE